MTEPVTAARAEESRSQLMATFDDAVTLVRDIQRQINLIFDGVDEAVSAIEKVADDETTPWEQNGPPAGWQAKDISSGAPGADADVILASHRGATREACEQVLAEDRKAHEVTSMSLADLARLLTLSGEEFRAAFSGTKLLIVPVKDDDWKKIEALVFGFDLAHLPVLCPRPESWPADPDPDDPEQRRRIAEAQDRLRAMLERFFVKACEKLDRTQP